eukprot:scaffold149301_cov17-Tisochrysis_lutea.AAC.1
MQCAQRSGTFCNGWWTNKLLHQHAPQQAIASPCFSASLATARLPMAPCQSRHCSTSGPSLLSSTRPGTVVICCNLGKAHSFLTTIAAHHGCHSGCPSWLPPWLQQRLPTMAATNAATTAAHSGCTKASAPLLHTYQYQMPTAPHDVSMHGTTIKHVWYAQGIQ